MRTCSECGTTENLFGLNGKSLCLPCLDKQLNALKKLGEVLDEVVDAVLRVDELLALAARIACGVGEGDILSDINKVSAENARSYRTAVNLAAIADKNNAVNFYYRPKNKENA